MKRSPLEITIDGKLVEKLKPKKEKRGHRIGKKRVQELYTKERPEWLIGSFEEYQELSRKRRGEKAFRHVEIFQQKKF